MREGMCGKRRYPEECWRGWRTRTGRGGHDEGQKACGCNMDERTKQVRRMAVARHRVLWKRCVGPVRPRWLMKACSGQFENAPERTAAAKATRSEDSAALRHSSRAEACACWSRIVKRCVSLVTWASVRERCEIKCTCFTFGTGPVPW